VSTDVCGAEVREFRAWYERQYGNRDPESDDATPAHALLAVLFLVPALPAVAVTRPSLPRRRQRGLAVASYVRAWNRRCGLRVKRAPTPRRRSARRPARGQRVIFDARGYV